MSLARDHNFVNCSRRWHLAASTHRLFVVRGVVRFPAISKPAPPSCTCVPGFSLEDGKTDPAADPPPRKRLRDSANRGSHATETSPASYALERDRTDNRHDRGHGGSTASGPTSFSSERVMC